jgi:hypothetical protein
MAENKVRLIPKKFLNSLKIDRT